jgi:MraZ protein
MSVPDLFASTHPMNVDAKGRVSVPSRFRALLGEQTFAGIYVRQHLTEKALECGGAAWLHEAKGLLDGLDPASEDYEAVSRRLIGEAVALAFDQEGRVMLPKSLMEDAGINGRVAFVGMKDHFAIWAPERLAERGPKDRARVMALLERRLNGKGAAS